MVRRFKSGELNVLICTNIGSEGMDFRQCQVGGAAGLIVGLFFGFGEGVLWLVTGGCMWAMDSSMLSRSASFGATGLHCILGILW